MMSTIDGKAASGGDTDILSDFFDLYTQTEDLLHGQAWMCGRVTMQMFAAADTQPLPPATRSINAGNYIVQHKEPMCFFGIDTKGVLRWDKNTIKLSNMETPLHLVIITTKTTPKEYLQYLQDKEISYLVAGEHEIDFPQLFTTIKSVFGTDRLLLEGGGHLNGSVLAADCVDELSIIVTPTILNRHKGPSIFERDADEPVNLKYFSFMNVTQLGKGSVLLRYERKNQ